MHNILGRMRELAMQSSNGSMTSIDRGYVQTEFAQLQAEIGRIQDSAKFNGKELVAPSASVITFQVGLDNTSTDQISVTFGGLSLSGVMTSAAVSGATTSQALAALSVIDTAISSVSTARSNFGAAMNRLEAATSNIQTMRLNISAANSRIRDVDVAEETARMSKNQVLSQAGIAILSQANQLPQLATQLVGR
jgi:flagellin